MNEPLDQLTVALLGAQDPTKPLYYVSEDTGNPAYMVHAACALGWDPNMEYYTSPVPGHRLAWDGCLACWASHP